AGPCLYPSPQSFSVHPHEPRDRRADPVPSGPCPGAPRGREVFVAGTILYRMILWELGKVFVMALVAITGILLMAGLIAEATQQGLGPSQILTAIPLLI